jgi:four helix bundle protein
MLRQTRDSYGYKKLLVYKKADEIQSETSHLTSLFCPSGYSPHSKTLLSLSDQMVRSARSTKQNIVEGWKRNSTAEYYTFLGYSIASNAELEEDCNDIIAGKYPELMGKKGIMGERGPINPIKSPLSLLEVEKLSFYPLDVHLPPIVQLKLRCKEVNFLFDRLQKSLIDKMEKDHNLSQQDRVKQNKIQVKKEDEWLEKFMETLKNKL